MQIRPKIFKKDGKPVFVVLPYAEYKRMQEAIEDLYDSLLLMEAREENRGKPTYTHQQILARIAARKRKEARRANGGKAGTKTR
jgi:PHD/YefM family antitoxin component YafN of YafNO toxin-antitoxin module